MRCKALGRSREGLAARTCCACATPTAERCPRTSIGAGASGGWSRRFPGDLASAYTATTTPGARSRTPCSRWTKARRHVQGTFIGYGERCGNADLSHRHPRSGAEKGLLGAGMNLSTLDAGRDAHRRGFQRHHPQIGKPFTGASAFAHKGGMHIDGVLKVSRSFRARRAGDRWATAAASWPARCPGASTVMEKVRCIRARAVPKTRPRPRAIIDELKETGAPGIPVRGRGRQLRAAGSAQDHRPVYPAL